MSVYVDKPLHRHGRMVMCHMLADTEQELHDMADRIGVARKHFQGNASTPHYDICKAKRQRAVAFGAVEVTRREVVSLIRRLREQRDGMAGVLDIYGGSGGVRDVETSLAEQRGQR